ncbi:MAG TPA: hypothetical protein VH092_13145, partial [Urbifossiella sp.]|nr:hypothetical protein [Urbifossiella sp.]
STPAADQPAPADLLPPPSRGVRIAWYAGAVVATAVALAAGMRLVHVTFAPPAAGRVTVVEVAGLRLDAMDLREPLSYDGDVLLIMPMVKATLERGSHWRNERMGYPGVYELYDFPVIDHLHFACIWLLGRVVTDWVVLYNLYHLLTWPLTTLTAMWAFRRLGLTLPAAAAGGVLYAFLPYHYLRGESHYFLAAYWVIPLSWLPALAVCKGDFPFFGRRPDGGYEWAVRTRAAGWQVVLAAATASAGAYYAFFACAVYAAAGAYGWAVHRTWKAAAAAGLVAGLVAGFGLVNHLPAVVYSFKYGRNTVTERFAEESELYAMKIAQLVLPIDAHNVTEFSRVKAMYTGSYPLNNENSCAPLGVVGAIGLLGLLGVLVVPNRLGWPYRPVAVLALFIVLFSTVGGFGALFNLLVFDQIRCWNRFSVYLAFLCLFAVLHAADRYLLTAPGTRPYRVWVLAGVVVVGLADQTPTPWFTEKVVKQTDRDAARFRADRRFFARIEEAAPGARVFCVPYIPFPEAPVLHEMGTYEHSRLYLHTATLIAGYAPIKYREADEWLRSVAFEHPNNRVLRMVARGFEGVLVDGRGFLTPADGNRVVREIRDAAGGKLPPEIIHEDGRQVFLDLRPYRDWLKGQNPALFEREETRELERVALCWLRGFPSTEPYGMEFRHRWAYRSAAFQLVNPTDRSRYFDFAATFDTDQEGEFQVTLSGRGITWVNRPDGPAPWEDTITFGTPRGEEPRRQGPRKTYRIEVPPGRHDVRFTCTPPPKFISGNTRPIYYYLENIGFTEVR